MGKSGQEGKPLVLITGVGGFVGHHAVGEALKQGYRVRATDLASCDFSHIEGLQGVEIVCGDITKKEDVKKMVDGVDYVVHIAAIFNLAAPKDLLIAVNRDASRLLAEESAKAGVKHFVYCSTCDIYGVPKKQPITEDTPANPENDYAESKYLGEVEVFKVSKETGMPVTAIRPSAIYGPWGIYTANMFFALPFIIERRFGNVPRFKGGARVNMAHVEDVAGSLIFVLGKEQAYGRAFQVADDTPVTIAELIDALCDALKVKRGKLVIPISKSLMAFWARLLSKTLKPKSLEGFNRLLQKGWQKIREEHGLKPVLNPRFDHGFFSYGFGDHVYDNSALKSLGYKLRYPDIREGTKQTAEWYRAQGWLPKR